MSSRFALARVSCRNRSFAPWGLSNFHLHTHGFAVGCILTPLCGCRVLVATPVTVLPFVDGQFIKDMVVPAILK